MFTIKICGITRPEDARAGADAGADAIGLNFYPQSSSGGRSRSGASDHRRGAGRSNQGRPVRQRPSKEICRIYDALDLDLIQLHGDEPPELLTVLGGRPVMKAFDRRGGWPAEPCSTISKPAGPCLPAADDSLGRATGPRLRRQRQGGRLVSCQGSTLKPQVPTLVLAGGLSRITWPRRFARPAGSHRYGQRRRVCSRGSRTRPPWQRLLARLG